MSTFKIVLLVASAALLLLILLIIWSLSPTIRKVSDEPAFRHLLHKELILQRAAFIHKRDKGMYDFNENVLTEIKTNPGTLIQELKPGSKVIIKEYKTYTNNLGSGFTFLYALGETTDTKLPFEYMLGTVEKELYADTPYSLSLAVWQDSTQNPIVISR